MDKRLVKSVVVCERCPKSINADALVMSCTAKKCITNNAVN